MLPDEKSLKHWIDNFYGYGSWQSPIWFIGYEEGGGELPEEVSDKLKYFKTIAPAADGSLCDIRELYKQVAVRWEGAKANLFSSMYEYRFGESAVQHGVWKNLINFKHAYDDERLPDLVTYQREHFLSQAGGEALIQLYPLPSPHSHAWYYNWLDLRGLEFLKSRASYQQHVYPGRINTILSNLGKYKPQLVLMYGMDNVNALKQSVQEFFPGAKFKMVKGIKLQTPQHHRLEVNGTILLVTTQIPALRHNRVETGFDWEDFGRKVREGAL